jgi:membrane protein DedA with SNARE-associated domain
MALDTTLGALLLAVGPSLLIVAYFLEGLLVGKLLHPSILFLLYVFVWEPTLTTTVLVAACCLVSVTAGQLLLYQGFDDDREHGRLYRAIPRLDRLPSAVRGRIGDRRMVVINRQFDRFGGHAIWMSNATPGFRGLMTIVAGLNGYPRSRFILLSGLGNAIYMCLLVAVATGALEAIRFLPWDLDPESFL